jgi:hypothetical protein
MGSRAIDAVDTIWLTMDRANNLMAIAHRVARAPARKR